MAPLPIPFPQSSEIYLTAISIVVAIVFQTKIQQFIEYKNGRILKLVALLFAIAFVFIASVLIFALVNLLIVATSIFTSMLKFGNNYGTVLYTIGLYILIMKPFLSNVTNERFDNLWTTKELVGAVILFLFGWILNNFLVTKP